MLNGLNSVNLYNSNIASRANVYTAQKKVASEKKNENQQQPKRFIDFSAYSDRNAQAAIKAQATSNEIKFSANFAKSIQYLNAKATATLHNAVDGRVVVPVEVFQALKNEDIMANFNQTEENQKVVSANPFAALK